MNHKIFGAIKNITIVLIIVKVIGFLKQAVIASTFGANMNTDIFLLVSELMENLGEVLFSSITIVFVTLYIQTKTEYGKEKRDVLVTSTVAYGLPLVILLLISIILFSDFVAKILAPGYTSAELIVIEKYIKIMAFALIFMFMNAVLKAILDAEKIFIPSKLEGLIKSCIIIIACIILGKKFGIDILIYAILAYYIIAWIYLSICVFKKIDIKAIRKPQFDNNIKKLIIYSLPLFISNGSVYLQNIVDKSIGSTLAAGSISYISYSGYLINTVHSLIIGSVCTVLFSYFSTYVAEGKEHKVKETLIQSVRTVLIIMMYIAIIFIIAAKDIVTIIYGRGEFNETAIEQTSKVLMIYALGLVFIGIRDLLIRAHYAYQDTKITMINGVIGTAINIVVSIILSKYIGVYGIIIGTVVSYFIVMLLSFLSIKKHITFIKESNIARLIIELLIISIAILGMSIVINKLLLDVNIIVRLLCNCGLATILYVIYLILIKNKEINDGLNLIRRRGNS